MKKIWVYIVFLLCFSSAISQAKSIEFSQERKIYRNGTGNGKNKTNNSRNLNKKQQKEINNKNGSKIISVKNQKEFFEKIDFGKQISAISTKTGKTVKGSKVYKVTSKNKIGKLKKGDYIYLDKLEKNHLEIFDSAGKFKKVLNLDGSLNANKTKLGIGRIIDVK